MHTDRQAYMHRYVVVSHRLMYRFRSLSAMHVAPQVVCFLLDALGTCGFHCELSFIVRNRTTNKQPEAKSSKAGA